MLSDSCLTCLFVCMNVCLSVLSVTVVYCGQTVGWIRMPLGMEVGLGPGDIVLDEDPKGKGKAFPILDTEPAVGCHYFPPDLRLPPQLHSITALWPALGAYTTW